MTKRDTDLMQELVEDLINLWSSPKYQSLLVRMKLDCIHQLLSADKGVIRYIPHNCCMLCGM